MLKQTMRAFLLLTIMLLATSLRAQKDASPQPAQDIATRTAHMSSMPGLLPLFWDAAAGKLYLEIPTLDASGQSPDLLYTHGLPYGTGSNDLGLDRGQVSEGIIVRFERFGPKVLLVQPQEAFRSSSQDPAEQLSVRQSFPESVLAGFKVEAENPDRAVLVDATDFFLRDAHGVAETLTALKQSTYKLDEKRSAIALDHTKVFPLNTEVESLLTFTTDSTERGTYVADVTPDPHALTIREHQSFMQLPGPGFTPRRFDPRAGYFPMSYRDYNAPLGDSLNQQFIIRHRLIKKDPNCTRACEAQTPIQYYVDRGAPEPIRTALVEGARWWDQAFQAAGWAPNTFRVDLLPADADPMDLRYNIIQWVHRYTRGWSYGAAITDPRTGEIIKGNVTLGSLRGRQDYLIAEALLSPYVNDASISNNSPHTPNNSRPTPNNSRPTPDNSPRNPNSSRHPEQSEGPLYSSSFGPANDPMLQMVLQRIRQLAAHETGHTLGLAHNFAASSFPHTNPDETISVMDYPHPYVTLKDGIPDLSHAYPVAIGIWDKVAIDYGYRAFPPKTDEHTALNKILSDSEHGVGDQPGLIYITDEDSRPFGSAQPHAHLWDDGTDPADELNRIIPIRAAALARFGENAIKPGAPLAQLEDTLVPLYLFTRYQTEAAIKEIGGLDYRYSLRGDGQPLPEIVAPDEQKKALAAVLKTLSSDFLTLPEPLLKLLPPRPPGLDRTHESFASHTGLTFDPIAAAESSADLTLLVLFNPQRASRLVEYHARNPQEPSLSDVIDATLKPLNADVRLAPNTNDLTATVGRAVNIRIVEWLLALAANPQASAEARSIARTHIVALKPTLNLDGAAYSDLSARIDLFLTHPESFTPAKPIEAPPGMPIGTDDDEDIF
jgi:hypothetical protein